jgi:hypothetical protein
MRRIRLKTLMIAILAIALLLGAGMALKRRSSRYYQLHLEHILEARRLSGEFRPDKAGIARLLRRAHWHNHVGWSYRNLADIPWRFDVIDPASVACRCRHCRGRYPGGVINDDVPLDFASP